MSRSRYWMYMAIIPVLTGFAFGTWEAALIGTTEEGTAIALLTAMMLPYYLFTIYVVCKRLQDAGYNMLWVLLYIVPLVNVFFTIIVGLLPTRIMEEKVREIHHYHHGAVDKSSQNPYANAPEN